MTPCFARLSGAAVSVEPESPDCEQAYVYVLYEHKSRPDRWVSLQLLRYMAVLWQRLIAMMDPFFKRVPGFRHQFK